MYFLPEPQGQFSLRPTLPQLDGFCGSRAAPGRTIAGHRRYQPCLRADFILAGLRIDLVRFHIRKLLLLLRRLLHDFHAHELGSDALAQIADHGFKQVEGLRLVFVERIALAISTQADHLAQMLQHQKMLAPEMIERLQQNGLFHVADNVRAPLRVAQWGPDVIRYVEKSILLQTLDHLWREHLVMLEHLRQVIGLRGYGQRDPLNEYKAEALNPFEAMIGNLREGVTAQLMRVEIMRRPPQEEQPLPYMEAHKIDPHTGEDEDRREARLVPAMAGNGGPARRGIHKIRRVGARSAATKLSLRLRQEI